MEDFSRKMLNEIRKRQNISAELPKTETIVEQSNLYNRFNILMKEAVESVKKKTLTEDDNKQNADVKSSDEAFVITNNDVQFGKTRQSQIETIKKTIGDTKFNDNALKYYKDIQDLVLNGELNGLGLSFQFRYKDPSGDGCYIWADGLQLTDTNSKTVNKIRDAFLNWKQSLVDDGDLMDKLYKEANKNS